MSTENIVSIEESGGGVVVTFRTRAGDLRSYQYGSEAAGPILAGADPALYAGTEVSGSGSGIGIAEILELGELL